MSDVGQLTTVLVPVLIVFIGGAGWWIRHERERREAVESQLSEKKYLCYMSLLNIFFDVLKAGNNPQVDLTTRMMDANRDLLIYGSDEVFRTYHNWTKSVNAGEKAMLHGFGEVILAIRRDMGHPKTKLTSDHVLRSFITDFDTQRAKGQI